MGGSSRKRQQGITAVEFAIVGAVTMTLIFGVLEVSRMMYTRTVLEEAVRRATRMAAVCPVNDPQITNAALFTNTPSGQTPVTNFTAANLNIQYLNSAGTAVASPGANTGTIKFVRVGIQNFTMTLAIPFASRIVPFNNISSTLPKESLGNFNYANIAC